MVYAADFAPYIYGVYCGRDRVIPLEQVRMIGWLEIGYEFPRGAVDEMTLFKLRKLIVLSKHTATRSRGIHCCDYCNPSYDPKRRPGVASGGLARLLGSSELWVPSAKSPDLIYAAPDLIYHYIVDHGYRPPDPFLEAVNCFDIDSDWDAHEWYQAFLKEHRERICREDQSG